MGYSGAYTYYRSYVGAGEGLAGGRMLTLIESHYNTLKSGISFGSLSCKAIADARPYLAATTTSPDEAVFTKPGTDTRYLHARLPSKSATSATYHRCSSPACSTLCATSRTTGSCSCATSSGEPSTRPPRCRPTCVPVWRRASSPTPSALPSCAPSSSAALTSPSRRPCGRTCWLFAALPAAGSRPIRSVCAASSATTCTSSTPATALRKARSLCRFSWTTLRACCCGCSWDSRAWTTRLSWASWPSSA